MNYNSLTNENSLLNRHDGATTGAMDNYMNPPIALYAAANPPYAAATSYSDSDDDSVSVAMMPWDDPDWIPLEKSGKQKTPNKIRGELQRYIDACRAGEYLLV